MSEVRKKYRIEKKGWLAGEGGRGKTGKVVGFLSM